MSSSVVSSSMDVSSLMVSSSAMEFDASSAIVFLQLETFVDLRGTTPSPLRAELFEMAASGMVELWTASVVS
jgi:hypothetical protein